MSAVYLAEDRKHQRKVALKILRPEIAMTVGKDRFLREIGIAARLSHPHILPVYDSGEAEGLLYYVMPHVEGESLRDRLEHEERLNVDEALQIAREVASALSYAHRHHVVHRDIKPANILLSGGHAVVTDFGVARAIGGARAESITEPGIAVGTPTYMSPEQASGELALDGRSDIYGLGCVLFEMLVGEPPYTGPTTRAVIAKCFAEPVPSARLRRNSVPQHVDAALLRALAKTPVERFDTAEVFAQALVAPALATAPTAPASIAVLPFINLSTDPDRDHRGDHQRSGPAHGIECGGAHVLLRLQGALPHPRRGRRGARCGRRARGKRAQIREPDPHHSPAHQRRRRIPSVVGAL
jgi:serine/threonine-protein kinase